MLAIMFRAALLACALLMPCLTTAHAQEEDAFLDSESEVYVYGFIRFVAYHEGGHLIMEQLAGLQTDPYWSREDKEDYADQFALVLLAPDADDADGVEDVLNAALGWLEVDPSASANDPHLPPDDRALEIICLLYGSNPVAFSDLEELVEEDMDCTARFQEMDREIEEVFRAQTEDFGQSINVVYHDPDDATYAAYDFLYRSELMEDLKADLEAEFYLTDPTTIQAIACRGRFPQVDTFYFNTKTDPNSGERHYFITLCYEMIDLRLKHGLKGLD